MLKCLMKTLLEEWVAVEPETVLSRLEVYHNQTQPLIDYYKGQGILKSVDGTVDMKDVFKAIVEILGA